MEQISVNDYIRTKDGRIEKVKTVNKYHSITYKTLVSARVEEKINWYSESGREVNEEDITKHSPNIIDLIEVGDYVNGIKVINILPETFGRCKSIELANHYIINWLDFRDIKSIVTKEQFKNVMYEV